MKAKLEMSARETIFSSFEPGFMESVMLSAEFWFSFSQASGEGGEKVHEVGFSQNTLENQANGVLTRSAGVQELSLNSTHTENGSRCDQSESQ